MYSLPTCAHPATWKHISNVYIIDNQGIMVRDTTLDTVERERILSPGKHQLVAWKGDRAVEEQTGESQGHSPRQEGYSGTTIHHYVQPMAQQEDSTYWTAGSRMVSQVEQGSEEGEVSLAMQASSRVRDEEMEKLARQAREARDVEDVIRRHTIRAFQKEMVGDTRKSVASPLRRKGDGSSGFVTPNSKNNKKKKTKAKKKAKKKKGFGIFGSLFANNEASPVATLERLRPPILVMDTMNNTNEEMIQEEGEQRAREDGCVSPLMVMSPGLSCGGLLDEAFASAMRGAEDSLHEDESKASGIQSQPELEDDDLFMALSPSSLLASPRVVKKLSRRPSQSTQNAQSESQTTKEDADTGLGGDQKSSHIQANEPEETGKVQDGGEKPVVPLHVHNSEMKKLGTTIQEMEAKYAARIQELEEACRVTARDQDGGEHVTLVAHHQELDRIRAQNVAFIEQLESEHALKVQGLEKRIESSSLEHAEDIKHKYKVLQEEKQSLRRQLEDAVAKNSNVEETTIKPMKARVETLEKSNQGLAKEVEKLKKEIAEMEQAAADAKQHRMEWDELRECLQRQVEDVQRQKSLIEGTSLALANQVASLQARLQTTEKAALDFQQQLRIQEAAMKTRVSTVENLNSDIQRLTRENTRLAGDKANMEEHLRRLTSILHTVTAQTGSFNGDGMMVHTIAAMNNSHESIHEIEPQVTQTGGPLMPTNGREKQQDGMKADGKPAKIPAQVEALSPRKAKVYKENRKAELDKQLLQLNIERERVDSELSQMPQNSRGKTVAQRHRRKQLDYKLEELIKDIAKVKRELRVLQK